MFIPNLRRALGGQRDVLLVYLLALLTTTAQGALELVFPLNLHRLGSPLPLVGLAVAMAGLGQLLSRLPGGGAYTLARARALNFGGQLLAGLSAMGLAAGGAWALQAALATVHGFAFGLVTTFLLATVIDARQGGRAMAATIAWYTAAISTGYALGAPLGAWCILALGHPAAFLVSGGVSLAAGALSLRLARAAAPGTATGPALPRPPALKALLTLPAGVWLATLLGVYINFVNDAQGAFFPIYAVGAGISVAVVGGLKSAQSLSATGIRFLAAGIFRFARPGLVNHVCVVTLALAVAGLTLTRDVRLLLVVFIAWGVSRGLLRVTSAVLVAEEKARPGAHVGLASGVYNAGLDLGSMLAPPVTGALAAGIGIRAGFQVIAVVLPLLYYALFFGVRLGARRSLPEPASAA